MTDQTAHDVTNHDRRLAREWAEHVESSRATWGDRFRAAARVILDAVPTPPTMADMTDEERAACQWMQADVGVERRIIVRVMDVEEGAVTLVESGDTVVCPHSSVTPRPDLPRLEWPGDQEPAPAPALPEGWRLADHKKHGRVIVTTQTPNRDGRVYYVIPAAVVPHADHSQGAFRNRMGFDWRTCDPAELTYIDADQGADTAPTNTLSEGSEWDDPDALARACEESGRDQIIILDRAGDAYVWVEMAEWWEGIGPISMNAPFTILHTGKEADQ